MKKTAELRITDHDGAVHHITLEQGGTATVLWNFDVDVPGFETHLANTILIEIVTVR